LDRHVQDIVQLRQPPTVNAPLKGRGFDEVHEQPDWIAKIPPKPALYRMPVFGECPPQLKSFEKSEPPCLIANEVGCDALNGELLARLDVPDSVYTAHASPPDDTFHLEMSVAFNTAKSACRLLFRRSAHTR
jgi:hypothetical protein